MMTSSCSKSHRWMYGSSDIMNRLKILQKKGAARHVPSPALASHRPSPLNTSAFTHELCLDNFLAAMGIQYYRE